MKHLMSAAARAAPLHGLFAACALHDLAAAAQFDAKTTPTIIPAATDQDTGQPSTLDLTAKKAHAGKLHLGRDSSSPPIGFSAHKRRVVDGTNKGKVGGYHWQHGVLLN